MKVCLFGGTFDPPHNGHLLIARAAREIFQPERIIFIPANIAPNKTEKIHSAAGHRIRMLELALLDEPASEVSAIELERGGISYSIDTIRVIKTQNNLSRSDLLFLIGADSLLELSTWRQPEDILTEAQVVVARRPGFDPAKVKPEYLEKVLFFESPLIPLSSSGIREIVRNGGRIDELVSPAVGEYIREYGLYRLTNK